MNIMSKLIRTVIVLMATSFAGLGVGQAADNYDAAVAHPGRSAADLKRDALDHPAQILRLSGIKTGMHVADMLAGDGYYSELLSYVVGPGGQVLMLNNKAFDHWSDADRQPRLAARPLPNVEYRIVDLEQ